MILFSIDIKLREMERHCELVKQSMIRFDEESYNRLPLRRSDSVLRSDES